MNLEQALIRGASMAAFADIGDRGLPIDERRFAAVQSLGNHGIRQLWQDHLDEYSLMREGSFSYEMFAALVSTTDISWPRTDTGRYKTDKDTLKEAAKVYGEPWGSVCELLRSIAEGSINGLKLGHGGRLYAATKPFGTLSGRAAPSTSEFLFLGPKWLRSLLQPPPGHTIMQLDWRNQEFCIAAALSGDPAMIAACNDGDPYLSFAKKAGAIPHHATKDSHSAERAAYKVVSLAVLMGMGVESIGRQTGTGYWGGLELLRVHKNTFRRFWEWSQSVAATGAAARNIETSFGLIYNPGDPRQYKPRTARNFLLQSTGSDMLRAAVLLLEEAGIRVIATIHDAVLVECETRCAAEIKKQAICLMEEASRIVLWNRLTVGVDPPRIDTTHDEVTCVHHPFHFQDKKGVKTWRKLAGLLKLPLDANHG